MEKCFSGIEIVDGSDVSAAFTTQLENVALAHNTFDSLLVPRFGQKFDGILIESGAARRSSSGSSLFQAYFNYVGYNSHINRSNAAICHFGIGSTKLLSTATITFPIGNLWISLDAHLVEADTLILLSIDDMYGLGICLNNHKDKLVHQSSGLKATIQPNQVIPSYFGTQSCPVRWRTLNCSVCIIDLVICLPMSS